MSARIPVLNSAGKLARQFLDSAVVVLRDASTGKIDPAVLPALASGCADFAFAGVLVPRTGVQYWLTPSWVSIKPRAFTATLGTMPTVGGSIPPTVTLRVNVNGAKLAEVVIQPGTRSQYTEAFTQSTIAPGSLITADVIEVAGAPTPNVAADAVLQLWWDQA